MAPQTPAELQTATVSETPLTIRTKSDGRTPPSSLVPGASEGEAPSSNDSPSLGDRAGGWGSPVIQIRGISKVYRLGDTEIHALRGVDLDVYPGEFVAIMGPSGSGKSTLMNMIGSLDQPTSGTYFLDGVETSNLSDDQLARVRNQKIGFVFQMFNLLPRIPAVEQVELPLIYAGVKDRRARALAALELMGISHRAGHRPSELSGGQQQRVAIARALVNQPAIIMADEPTGSLDTRTGEELMGLLQRLNREQGITVVLVTHERDIAAHARRIVEIRDGRVVRDQLVDQPIDALQVLAAMPAPEDADVPQPATGAGE